MSRENSHFKESRKEGGGKLQISYVGYKTQDVDIAPDIRVKLEPDAQAVEAVVVTGMTKMDKRLFTGAADQLVADDVKLAGMADISRGLEGRSAGVSVQNVSGTFGTAPKIRVRGATSIYGSSKPLWVVDGVIMEERSSTSTPTTSPRATPRRSSHRPSPDSMPKTSRASTF